MSENKCPGQNPQYWRPEDACEVSCPNCKEIIEFFKDEPKRRCFNCKQEVVNPNVDFGCALWCPKAVECIGQERYQQLVESAKRTPQADKHKTKKDLLLFEMERYFGKDARRINHARNVLGYAEALLEKEKSAWAMAAAIGSRTIAPGLIGSPTAARWPGDHLVVMAAAILHDIGIHKAEEKYKSSAGNYQEMEGPPIAREMMQKLRFKKEVVEEVCEIIANHHSPGKINTINFKVLYDADWLVNLKDEFDTADKEKLAGVINKVFLTESGKELAAQVYLKGDYGGP